MGREHGRAADGSARAVSSTTASTGTPSPRSRASSRTDCRRDVLHGRLDDKDVEVRAAVGVATGLRPEQDDLGSRRQWS
jgi:hypothetical protein